MATQYKFDIEGNIGEEAFDMNGEDKSTEVSVVEQDGTPVDVFKDFKDLSRALTSGKYNNTDLKNFEEKVDIVFQNTLSQLLREQDKEPFKHGGETIAYRSDVIILRNRSKMNSAENVLFDIISGLVSSNPTDKSYSIDVRDVSEFLPYKDKSYSYRLLNEATETLKTKALQFSVEVNGKKINLEYPMFNPIAYVSSFKNRKNNVSYISFIPSDFLRILLITAGKIHGAYYPITGPAQISGKYQKTFYYYMESKKDYKETPYSTPGVFSVPLDELHDIIGYPASYKPTDIRRYIIDSVQKEIESIPEIDFVFSYESYKQSTGKSKKRLSGFRFVITRKAVSVELSQHEFLLEEKTNTIRSTLKEYGYEQKAISEIMSFCEYHDISYKTLTEALVKTDNANIRSSKTQYLLTVLSNGIFGKDSNGNNGNGDGQLQAKPTGFTNFPQRANIDYDALQEKLIRQSMGYSDDIGIE